MAQQVDKVFLRGISLWYKKPLEIQGVRTHEGAFLPKIKSVTIVLLSKGKASTHHE